MKEKPTNLVLLCHIVFLIVCTLIVFAAQLIFPNSKSKYEDLVLIQFIINFYIAVIDVIVAVILAILKKGKLAAGFFLSAILIVILGFGVCALEMVY